MRYCVFVFSLSVLLFSGSLASACINAVKEYRAFFWVNSKVTMICTNGVQEALIEADALGLVPNKDPLRDILALPSLKVLTVKVPDLSIGQPIRLPGVDVAIATDHLVFANDGALDVTPGARAITGEKGKTIVVSATSIRIRGDEAKRRLIANGGNGQSTPDAATASGGAGGTIKLIVTEIQNVPLMIASVKPGESDNAGLAKASRGRILVKRKVGEF